MNKIAVCIVLNDLFYQTRYCIENLIEKTKLPIRLYLWNNASEDIEVQIYCNELIEKNNAKYGMCSTKYSISECYNKLIDMVEEDNICIFPINILVNKNWLEDLVASKSQTEKTGIISIRKGINDLALQPILHTSIISEDILKGVFCNKNNSVEGILYFKKVLYNEIGKFDDNLSAIGYEQMEYCFRVNRKGYRNYYIRNQTCVAIKTDNEVLFPTKTPEGLELLKQRLEQIVTNRV